MKHRYLVLFALLILGSMGLDWSAGWEAEPDDNEQLNLGDNRIREFKDQVRKRMSVEHQVSNIPGENSDTGLHIVGSARCFYATTAPTTLVQSVGGYNASADSNYANTLITDEDPSGATLDTGTGRCWIDTDGPDNVAGNLDDFKLFVWSEAGDAWVAAKSESASADANDNLIYNGHFGMAGSNGDPASTARPDKWDAAAPEPTYTYQDPVGTSEGEGLAVNLTGTGANGGISQTIPGLKASTQYIFRARVNPTTAADVCHLEVSGGTATVTDTSAVGTAVYETLEVEVTTTAGAASLVVEVGPDAATDVCRIASVVGFEKNPPVGLSSQVTCRRAIADVANFSVATESRQIAETCSVTVPDGIWNVEAAARVVFDGDSPSAVVETGLYMDTTSTSCAAGTLVDLATQSLGGNATGATNWADDLSDELVRHTVVKATVGATYSFCVRLGNDNAANVDLNDDDVETGQQLGYGDGWIQVDLVPLR